MDLAQRISKLSPEQRKLLERKLEKQNIDILQLPITKEKGDDGRDRLFPLSFEQERLWFIQQLEPANTAYNLVRATKLDGNLDKESLARSIHAIVRRHEVLRTQFLFDKEKPLQVILDELKLPLKIIDLKNLPPQDREREMNRVILAESLLPFDLTKAPLLRTRLIELGEQEHLFLLVIHHIISDGTSIQLFIRDMVQFYEAFSRGMETPADLPQLPVQYVDYAVWQRRWFEGDALDTGFRKGQQTYWLDRFSGEIPVLNLPFDYPRPMLQSFTGTIHVFDLDPYESDFLKAMALKERTTLYIVLLTLFNIFLSKLSGQEDIVVGTPVAGRRHPGVQNLVGMFVNTLALRNYPQHHRSFQNFLEEVKEHTLNAFENQEYRYEDIIGKVAVNRDTGRNPLFDVMFLVRNLDYAEIDIPGLTWKFYDWERKTAKFDLTLTAWEEEDTHALRFSFEYCTKLFHEATIKRFARYFQQVVCTVMEAKETNVDIKIADLDIVPPGEKKKLLENFNNTRADYPGDKTIHQLFAQQVERTPYHTGIVGSKQLAVGKEENIHLTYRELNEQSGRLAHLLTGRGVGPDTIVAIMVERSVEMIVGMLGILEAGGAYLPIDPDYPRERVNFMLADSGAEVLLTSPGPQVNVKTGVEENPGQPRRLPLQLVIKALSSTLTSTSGQVCPANLAYIIYTSGTTGKPKGALIQHYNVVRLMFNDSFQFEFNDGDVWTLFHSCCFDFSVWEMYGALLYGGKLILVPKLTAQDPKQFLQLLIKKQVTVLNQTPGSFYHLTGEALHTPGTPLHLKYVIFGGEALNPAKLKEWQEAYPETRLVNMYGITETTVHVTFKDITPKEIRSNVSNIGSPIPTLCAYIVDKYMKLQPLGAAGELFVGGKGVCRGYLNRPELTTEKFCRNFLFPSDSITHAISFTRSPIYRTGDLARWLPNGDLEYRGRIDHQVKIRGYRVELGEIEAHLLNHRQVKEAVVTAKQSTGNDTGSSSHDAGGHYLCAYIVSRGSDPVNATQLKDHLSRHLPAYMIPAYFIQLETIPLTSNNKVDLTALHRLHGERLGTGDQYVEPRDQMEKILEKAWIQILGLEKISVEDNFFDLGANSFDFIKLCSRLKEDLGKEIPVVTLFQYTNISALAQHLQGKRKNRPPVEVTPVDTPWEDIAVIGMSGCFPGARDTGEFWHNLEHGIEGISFFNDEQLKEAGGPGELLDNPDYVKAKGIIEDKETFDSAFFGYIPSEAGAMDPQMRLFHQHTWGALEDAGYPPSTYDGLIGLYAGATQNTDWTVRTMFSETGQSMWNIEILQFTNKDFLPSRVSYNLNLKGPVVSVNTACSTSLVAIHLACRALIDKECNMVVAGGVTLHPGKSPGYLYQEGMIGSPDGHCRTFDINARGTVSGEGIAIVILKPLQDALEDNDTIHAVIKGTATNNDGIRKAGYTAPSVEGQYEVIKKAQLLAQCPPESITYVETHGTGTPLGDPIEIKALAMAFDSEKPHRCALGSVKSNIGHLDSAAGAAGLIKTVLALKHRMIPPSLHFETPNPGIDFENSPFYVNTRLQEWKGNGCPLRAGVSSFGIGGTNVHVIVEEAPVESETQPHKSHPSQLILLSAKTRSVLEKMNENLANHLIKNPRINLADAAYTLQLGRKAFNHRAMLLAPSTPEAVEIFNSGKGLKISALKAKKPEVVFMFSGLGSQYENMGLELYQKEPVFREEMDRCFEILKTLLGYDIKEILYPSPVPPAAKNELAENSDKINQSEIAQPVIFLFEYALAKLLISWDIEPYAMIGYSFGEYVAACVAGVFSLKDALKLVVTRGQLVQKMPPGAMLSVPLPLDQVEPLLDPEAGLSLAIDNGPSCVVSGSEQAIKAFEKLMQQKKLLCMRVGTSHALHSAMMNPMAAEFESIIGAFSLNPPKIPYISNVTGDWITDKQAANPGYWSRHLRQTVRFSEGMKRLLAETNSVYIEVGPGKALSNFARQQEENPNREAGSKVNAVNLVRHPDEKATDYDYLLARLGHLWLYGVTPHWKSLYNGGKRQRIPLPTYPFQGKVFAAKGNIMELAASALNSQNKYEIQADMADWFYIPVWEQIHRPFPVPASESEDDSSALKWLLFMDKCGLGPRIHRHLDRQGHHVITVAAGPAFSNNNPREFVIDPGQDSHYKELFTVLQKSGQIPHHILHLWNVTGGNDREESLETIDDSLNLSYYSMLYIVQAIGELGISDEIHLQAITDNLQDITGEENLCPGKAPILGTVKIIPLEYPNIHCRGIDVVLPGESNSAGQERLVRRLSKQLQTPGDEPVLALRGNHFWKQTYKPQRLEVPPLPRHFLKEKGVYLITGGFGGMGFTIAQHLAQHYRARLILVNRSPFPSREEWPQYLNVDKEAGKTSLRTQKIREMERVGAEVIVSSADVSDYPRMQQVLQKARQRFGHINGVIHTAGLADYTGVIQRRTREMSESILAPKIRGTLVLDSLLKDTPPDFLVLFSSIGNILYQKKFGQAAYNAGNEYLDTFAGYKNAAARTGGPFTASINWTDWVEVGMAVVAANSKEGSDRTWEKLALKPLEGAEVFQRILEHRYPRVAISRNTLDAMIRYVSTGKKLSTSQEEADILSAGEITDLAPRPHLTTVYAAPQNEMEKLLARVWTRFFGIQEVGVHDDFFDLGGDSLKAMTVIAKIHQETGARLSLPEFFNAPTISELAALIDTTSHQGFQAIEPVEKKEYYPLPPAQKRLHILQEMFPENIGYNLSNTFMLEGPVRIEKIQAVFRQLIQRHESLRTSFIIVDDEPMQWIHEETEFEIEYFDLDNREDKIPESIIKVFIRPFDLSRAPMMRVGLLEIEKDRHIFMLDMHHIITDAPARLLLVKEFMEIYSGRILTPMSLQYKDYAVWLENETRKQAIARQEAYWLDMFKGEIPVLDLPYDQPRPAVTNYEGHAIEFELGSEEIAGLKRRAAEGDVTLFMVLLGAFNIFLHRLSSQEDIVVGSPTAGRHYAGLEPVIGMFINTLPLRCTPAANKTVRDFFQEVKTRTLAAFENQEYPFEELVDKVVKVRNVGRHPIFDFMFILQNMGTTEWSLPGLTLKNYYLERTASTFDITLTGVEVEDHMKVTLEYRTRLFNRDTINRFITYFRQLVQGVIRDPRQKIGEMEILPEEERKLILEDFNNTDIEYPEDISIYRQFAGQAARTPDTTAISGPSIRTGSRLSLTYKQLNGEALQLACLLREKGAKPGTIIAILVERSVELMVGILGILNAQCVYLPIDPHHPGKRIRYMLKASNTEILVIDNLQFSSEQFTCINLTDKRNERYDTNAANPPVNTGHSLAYVIFTSGTTGIPKGVMIENWNLSNFIAGINRIISFTVGMRMYSLTTVSFDIFGLETYMPLTSGSTLLMGSLEEQVDPKTAAQVLKKEIITHFQVTPSRLQLFLSQQEAGEGLKELHYLLVGGEAFPEALLQQARAVTPAKIYNLYGPTETTIWSTVKDVTADPLLNIGRPIANTRVYILNKTGHPQPIGVPGELLIGGKGVGRGYLNNPELTYAKFQFLSPVTLHPYHRSPLYNTGDLARWLADGTIDFLGRTDHQVKIRGFRIELKEIENRLNSHKAIKEAVVTAKADENDNRYLCAYYLPSNMNAKEKGEVNVTELREFLSVLLPDYMIPSYFVPLERFPLTPNKKIDRKMLPDPIGSRPQVGSDYLEPQTDLEKKIARHWTKVLKVPKVGIHDNFFALGGNSLSIIRLNSQLRRALGKDIPVVAMFRYLTISAFTRYLITEQNKANLPGQSQKKEESLKRARKVLKNTIQRTRRSKDAPRK